MAITKSADFTPEIEYANDGSAHVKKLRKMGRVEPGMTVLIEGPPGTYLRFTEAGWPFKEPVPKKPVPVPAGPYTLSPNEYNVECGKLNKNGKFEAAPGGLTIPGDL